MNTKKMTYTFSWHIENYSHCWHKNGDELISPKFTPEGMKGSVWTLGLYPRGYDEEYKGYISLFVSREPDDGLKDIPLKFELSIFAEDGSTFRQTIYSKHLVFSSGMACGVHDLVKVDEVLVHRKSEYLGPRDTLNVRCQMWWGESRIQRISQSAARTRISVEKLSFIHLVEGFSDLKTNQSHTVKMGYRKTEECMISSNLKIIGDSYGDGNIIVEITSSAVKSFSQCTISLIDQSGKLIGCGKFNNRFDEERNDTVKLLLSLTRQEIIRGRKYLKNDELSLQCELVFSAGLDFQKIEKIDYKIPKTTYILPLEFIRNREELPECYSALDDLKTIYNEQILPDIELKTLTRSFPAHKAILCARSPVLSEMLRNNVKEDINILDLEDDILNRFLLFLYCDELEELQWKTATRLYYAAHKYEVEKLKLACSNFLEDNIAIPTATELLLLADTHGDSKLKEIVEDFIFQHDVEVFGSDEWENLVEKNPQLALKTMCLKHQRKK